MNRYLIAIGLLAVSWWAVFPAQVHAQDAEDVISLFDGHSLEGWKGDLTLWRVEDGAITGETRPEAPLAANSFLIWEGEMEDFELRLKFRIFSGNSGVQYRSRELGDFRVGGYQADIDADGNWVGILYEEQGRGILARRGERVTLDAHGERQVEKLADFDAEEFAKSVPSGEWHEFVIRAVGPHLVQSINGITTIELHDGDASRARTKGIIALQLHVGPAMKVQFKDLTVRPLNPE